MSLNLRTAPSVDEILKVFNPASVDWRNPLPYALRISGFLAGVSSLTGPAKLDLLKQVLRKAISTAGISEQERQVALRFVDDVLPVAIDAALAVSRGEVSFAVVSPTACLPLLCSGTTSRSPAK